VRLAGEVRPIVEHALGVVGPAGDDGADGRVRLAGRSTGAQFVATRTRTLGRLATEGQRLTGASGVAGVANEFGAGRRVVHGGLLIAG
jgi:hypothetical protein